MRGVRVDGDAISRATPRIGSIERQGVATLAQAGQDGAGCMRQPAQRFRQFGDRRPFGCSKHLDRLRQLRPEPRRARARERLSTRRSESASSGSIRLSERWRSIDLLDPSLFVSRRLHIVSWIDRDRLRSGGRPEWRWPDRNEAERRRYEPPICQPQRVGRRVHGEPPLPGSSKIARDARSGGRRGPG